MAPTRILDSHIHLWAPSAANPSSHAWMTPGSHLCAPHTISAYKSAICLRQPRPPVSGAVYIETDRRLDEAAEDVLDRAAEPLKEIASLRDVVEGDGKALLWGIVPWAPLDAGIDAFRRYLLEAERIAGPEAWRRVGGFRYLLQGIRDEAGFRALVESEDWVGCLRECMVRGWCFDLGVDMRGVGVWQVERAVEMVERVNGDVGEEEGLVVVLNHLCKPDMQQLPTTPEQLDAFHRWAECMRRFSRSRTTFMKLSGVFSEIADQDPAAPWSVAAIIERMKPWLDVLFQHFALDRIMFGSDWPVCNVRGPGDELAWDLWRDVVEGILETYGFDERERDGVWYGNAVEAYRLSPPAADLNDLHVP
ncbi:hypothetical protein K490DRAFT_62269 [Saccharata proteae CBS 121410]|uniref:Amidohydrolase-related domain-containing protein n=1 Tax=Saccharata proteae CBS 121410 TaxID=1314787 RepID=A0A9P4I0Q1_9PEZI|nr:hypothetical protein K490DRAFT_62269 [Saccharata proteae CBS 121410]